MNKTKKHYIISNKLDDEASRGRMPRTKYNKRKKGCILASFCSGKWPVKTQLPRQASTQLGTCKYLRIRHKYVWQCGNANATYLHIPFKIVDIFLNNNIFINNNFSWSIVRSVSFQS